MDLVLIFLRTYTALSATQNEYLLVGLMIEWVNVRSLKSKMPSGHQGCFEVKQLSHLHWTECSEHYLLFITPALKKWLAEWNEIHFRN